jgi:glycosyltransferase involved in cell wall biosynthesis
MENPLVSISLVVFNQEDYLRQAIESCLMQNVEFNYEIIIHDDKSTDNSAKIIQEFAINYPEMIVPIIQTENQFSKGTEIISKYIVPKAKGKYIAFLEADDFWDDPQKLQNQTDFMETHPNVSMCFTATKRFKATNPEKYKIKRYRNRDSVVSPEDVILIGGPLVDMCSVMTKSSVFANIPDWYYSSRMWDNTVPLLSTIHGEIQYLNVVTAAYRENTPGSYTQNNKIYNEKRINHIRTTLTLLESFNRSTNFAYQKYVNRKMNVISNGLLLLIDPEADDFIKYYSQLTPGLKLEYKIFKFIRNYQLWKKYRYLLSYFRKIKYV